MGMQEHGTGTAEDHDEVLGILHALKSQVFAQTNNTQTAQSSNIDISQGGIIDYALNNFNYFWTVSVPTYISSLPIPKTAADLRALSLDEIISLVPLFTVLLLPLFAYL